MMSFASVGSYQHYPSLVLHGAVLPISSKQVIHEKVSSSVAVVMMRRCDIAVVFWGQVAPSAKVVVVVIDGVEAVGMVTIGAAVGPP